MSPKDSTRDLREVQTQSHGSDATRNAYGYREVYGGDHQIASVESLLVENDGLRHLISRLQDQYHHQEAYSQQTIETLKAEYQQLLEAAQEWKWRAEQIAAQAATEKQSADGTISRQEKFIAALTDSNNANTSMSGQVALLQQLTHYLYDYANWAVASQQGQQRKTRTSSQAHYGARAAPPQSGSSMAAPEASKGGSVSHATMPPVASADTSIVPSHQPPMK